jgi:sugar phosphate isomerase/epimerase
MMPPIDLFIHTYSLRFRLMHDPDFGVIDLLDRAVADGLAGIGLNVNGPHYRFLGGDDQAHVRTVAEAIAERGLAVDIETSGTDGHHLSVLIDLALALGADHVRTYTRHTGPRTEVVARTIRDLVEIGPIAEDRGVPVLLENHEEFTGLEIARILERVDHPYVGALYDYGNSMMLREDPIEALEAMLPWTRAAHLKDHVVMHDMVCGVPTGEGVLPIVEITQRLLEAGMTRIAFENVWSYTCPFHPRQDGLPEVSEEDPIFREHVDPEDPVFFLSDVTDAVARDPGRVIDLEDASYERAWSSLQRLFDEAGIVRAERPAA